MLENSDKGLSLRMITEFLQSLECPACNRQFTNSEPSKGQCGEAFLKLNCKACGEDGFFQLSGIKVADDNGHMSFIEPFETMNDLQQDWRDWYDWKQRHLNQTQAVGTIWLKISQHLLFLLILLGWGFFFTNQIHLLDGIFENPESRQIHIQNYVNRIADLSCLSDALKNKLKEVPILYTRQSPYHRNHIQFGEAGIYWGEEKIMIHRSNFWFFGLPRRNQLIETIIHEVRHHANPSLGHSSFFYKLVAKDFSCVLGQW